MKKYFLISLLLAIACFSCRKAIEPLDFKSNPVDPASGIEVKMIEIDSINSFQGTFGPYRIVYFHCNIGQIPKTLGTPEKIDVYFDKEYRFYRVFNFNNNKYSFYIYGGPSDTELGFIITSVEKRYTDLIIPVRP